MKKTSMLLIAILLLGSVFFLESCKKNYYGVEQRAKFLNGKYAPEVTDVLPESVMGIKKEEANKNMSLANGYSYIDAFDLGLVNFQDLKPDDGSFTMDHMLESIGRNRTTIERTKDYLLNSMFTRVNFQNSDEEPIYGLIANEANKWVSFGPRYYKHEVADEYERLYEYEPNRKSAVTMYNNGAYQLNEYYEIGTKKDSYTIVTEDGDYFLHSFYSYYTNDYFVSHSVEIEGFTNRISYVEFKEIDGKKFGVMLDLNSDMGEPGMCRLIIFEGDEFEASIYTSFSNSRGGGPSNDSYYYKDGYLRTYRSSEKDGVKLGDRISFDLRYLENIDKIDTVEVTNGSRKSIDVTGIFLKDGTKVEAELPIYLSFKSETRTEEKDILDEEGNVIATVPWIDTYQTDDYCGTVYLGDESLESRFDIGTYTLDDIYEKYGFLNSGVKVAGEFDTFWEDYKAFANDSAKTLRDFRVSLTDELKNISVAFTSFDTFVDAFIVHNEIVLVEEKLF
ncbi:hypothetical protein LJC17_03890 [Acholeplasma sp. OttesenSCG-928-E16]|nr:hypothetical protein [Acholeplasma sp. OttesenSCG-928-E16]